MEFTGKVVNVLPTESGTTTKGTWQKKSFLLETKQGQYTKNIAILLFGDVVDKYKVTTGETVKVFADIESREYNGKFYTDVKAWKIEAGSEQTSAAEAADTSSLPF